MNPEKTMDQTDSNDLFKMLAESGYSDKAIQYYIEKPYMGDLPGANHTSEMLGTCGDTMKIYLQIDAGKITDVKYQVLGCPGAVSAAMAVVDLVKGGSINNARSINDGDVFKLLGDIPVKKHHCIQLAVKTLNKALDEFQTGDVGEISGIDELVCQSNCPDQDNCCKKTTP
jgi:nitrogen fixation NifU-like protein